MYAAACRNLRYLGVSPAASVMHLKTGPHLEVGLCSFCVRVSYLLWLPHAAHPDWQACAATCRPMSWLQQGLNSAMGALCSLLFACSVDTGLT